MNDKEELLKRLNDKEFLKLFSGVNSADDIAKIAKLQGYNITSEDVKSTSLSEDLLEGIAGGKGNVSQSMNVMSSGSGNISIGSQSQEGHTQVTPSTTIDTDVKTN